MDTPFAPLATVPREIWEHIALYTALLHPTGRLSALLPLLSTCKFLHHNLCFDNNKALYARIFDAMFDPDAAHRRMGDKAIRSRNLASQLRVYCEALNRIRLGDIHSPSLLNDFWTAYFMCVENDGRNIVQLRKAGLPQLVQRFVSERLWEDSVNGWPVESPINSLVLWILWCMTTPESLAAESQATRQNLISCILPFVVMAFKYQSFYAPDNHFHLPLPEDWQRENLESIQTAHGHWPLYRDANESIYTCTHYGSTIRVCPPPITAPAKLLYFARREMTPLGIPPGMPIDRADAIARNILRGPTQADVMEVNSHRGAKCILPTDWDWKAKLTPEELKLEEEGIWTRELKAPSAAWDNEWERIVYCGDPWSQPELKGVLYTFGALDGLWQGRLLVPEENGYVGLVGAREYPPGFSEQAPFMSTWPVFMRLREHHCISPAIPVVAGHNPNDAIDDGIRNGWFPSVEIRESGGKVTIQVPPDRVTSEYETFVEGRPNSHNEETCHICINNAALREEELQQRVQANRARAEQADKLPRHEDYEEDFAMADLARNDSHYGSDDEDTYEAKCSGIQDIIFTGETDPAHGMAWGNFSFLGRVRPWDGLIALVRVPLGPPVAQVGRPRWVFRGHLYYGQVLVGSWRGMTTSVTSIPWEGPFVMSRRA